MAEPIPPPAASDAPTMRRIKMAFWIGETVYLRVRTEQFRGLVTQAHVLPVGIDYSVSWEDGTESRHWEMELTREFVPDFGQGES